MNADIFVNWSNCTDGATPKFARENISLIHGADYLLRKLTGPGPKL